VWSDKNIGDLPRLSRYTFAYRLRVPTVVKFLDLNFLKKTYKSLNYALELDGTLGRHQDSNSSSTRKVVQVDHDFSVLGIDVDLWK